ncbi:flagellar protein FlgN [Pseudoalteromonas piscicida]|uniref:Flagellar biogenesis protein n=1 Tax=Pseudoalteromonas piscicida TaxID=43662 RepID=A0A2A5JV70_PSEO7|nr:flagellar protein FlgN [Pseudoalteromonas piscicida]PCK33246.1 flagellar biogenesis protein [Pseudoalteromonas piscicida]
MDDLVRLCHHKLSEQISTLEAMTQLLARELDELASRRGDNLKEIAREKLTLISKLQKLDKELSKTESQIFEREEIIPLVSKVRTLLSECQTKNEINAKTAHQANVSTRELKSILIGAPTSVTYGQDGNVKSSDGELVKNLKA